jgi:Zn-dependent protease
MKWSWKIARLLGIEVYIHATFLLIVAWVAYASWSQFHTIAAVASGVAFILALFACVVLHEYGHALAARRFGVKTRDITLYPFGGVARLERIPEKPIEELWVALAGPAVNVALAVVIGLYLILMGAPLQLNVSATEGGLLARLFGINLLLAAFNLLPAFPMDGGRVLRALLGLRMDHLRATQIAANVGQAMAFLFGFIGLLTDPWLIFIAFFVWIGAEQEASTARIKHALSGIPVSRAMQTNFTTLTVQDNLARAIELVLAGSQHDFPVLDGDRVAGVLERDTLIKVLATAGQGGAVAEVMRRDLPQVDSHEMVESALGRLEEAHAKTLPVTHAGRLLGLITSENITELMMIRTALGVAASQT